MFCVLANFDGLKETLESFGPRTKNSTTPNGVVLFLAGVAGFEPTNAAVKVLCLTA